MGSCVRQQRRNKISTGGWLTSLCARHGYCTMSPIFFSSRIIQNKGGEQFLGLREYPQENAGVPMRQIAHKQPDSGAFVIDAFAVDQGDYPLIYCFPPFSLIGRVLQKIEQDQTEAV